MERVNAAEPFTFFAFTARKPGLSMEDFRDYYENHHIPYFMKLVDGTKYISKYTRHYVQKDEKWSLSAVGPGLASEWEHDCVVQVVYKDVQAFRDFLNKFEEVKDKIDEDEKNFLDSSRTKAIFVGESASSELE